MNTAFRKLTRRIDCCGEQLLLHPNKVLFWPSRKTLLASDLHIGKEHTFARAGIPVPSGISEHMLSSLMRLVDDCAADRLIILGDLLHAEPDYSEPWQSHFSTLLIERSLLTVKVVIGNHDSSTARAKVTARLDWVDSLHEPPFLFEHKPRTCHECYVIAGHIHPAYRLKIGRQSIRAPAFWFRRHYAVLPAFGEFTGAQLITPDGVDQIFLTIEDSMFEIRT